MGGEDGEALNGERGRGRMQHQTVMCILRLHPDLLNRIEASTTDVERCLEKVLSEWLKREYDTIRFGLPSWQLLVAAVAHPAGGKDHALAGQIAGRHNGKLLVYMLSLYMDYCIHSRLSPSPLSSQTHSSWDAMFSLLYLTHF